VTPQISGSIRNSYFSKKIEISKMDNEVTTPYTVAHAIDTLGFGTFQVKFEIL
jgi:hypothetical protein